ncbi:MAG: molybdopterin dinucleotide binding domain-containing protein [Candidatus Kryptoniota bacterium]
MSKGITRRNLLKLLGGSAVGLMLTPIPWKLLDETAKWSQNWSWIPVPRNGRINFKYTTCTLCPKSCGVRARCVDNQPVSLTGIPNHPISGGGLCAIGLGGHLLPYHPSRLLQTFKQVEEKNENGIVPFSYEETIAAITEAISSSGAGSVAVIDGQPNRSISFAYRNFLAGLKNGVYIIPPNYEGISAEIAEKVLSEKNTFGFDAENAGTILSFGTPVLDGWGTLGQFSKVIKSNKGSDKIKIIQVESVHSRTAQLADEWIPVRPGTETIFALAIANELISERLCDTQLLRRNSTDFQNGSGHSFTDLTEEFSPASVAEATGVPENKIRSIARELASRKPSFVVFANNPGAGPFSRDEQIIFMDLNILLGATGIKGGLIPRKKLPDAVAGEFADETLLTDVPDHSIKVLIMDGAESGNVIPWRFLQQKLVTRNPVVVSLSAYFSGISRHADYLIPSPSYLESYNDSPTPAAASMASYAISIPVLAPPTSAVEPLDVIKRIAASAHSKFQKEIQSLQITTLLKNRVRKLFEEGKGIVFDASTGKTTKLTSVVSSERLMNILSNGGCWYGDKTPSMPDENFARFHFLGGEDHGFERLSATAKRGLEGSELVLLPYAVNIGQPHQLMAKLYRESDLREPAGIASINPETGKRMGLIDGSGANIKTEIGSSKVTVKFDKAVMPGIVQAATGQAAVESAEIKETNILEICKIENDSTWRITKAEILQA